MDSYRSQTVSKGQRVINLAEKFLECYYSGRKVHPGEIQWDLEIQSHFLWWMVNECDEIKVTASSANTMMGNFKTVMRQQFNNVEKVSLNKVAQAMDNTKMDPQKVALKALAKEQSIQDVRDFVNAVFELIFRNAQNLDRSIEHEDRINHLAILWVAGMLFFSGTRIVNCVIPVETAEVAEFWQGEYRGIRSTSYHSPFQTSWSKASFQHGDNAEIFFDQKAKLFEKNAKNRMNTPKNIVIRSIMKHEATCPFRWGLREISIQYIEAARFWSRKNKDAKRLSDRGAMFIIRNNKAFPVTAPTLNNAIKRTVTKLKAEGLYSKDKVYLRSLRNETIITEVIDLKKGANFVRHKSTQSTAIYFSKIGNGRLLELYAREHDPNSKLINIFP